MHGISEDKLQGMEERRNAWYQGLRLRCFLSLILVAVCGVLHGFGSELFVFLWHFIRQSRAHFFQMAGNRQRFFEVLIKVLYLLLYPVMLTVFVCYELKFKEYDILVPIFVIAGVVVLILGAVSYFATTHTVWISATAKKQTVT